MAGRFFLCNLSFVPILDTQKQQRHDSNSKNTSKIFFDKRNTFKSVILFLVYLYLMYLMYSFFFEGMYSFIHSNEMLKNMHLMYSFIHSNEMLKYMHT
jgi:putative exporter of polyketide antibiotics